MEEKEYKEDRDINLNDSEDPYVKNLTALFAASSRHRSQKAVENTESEAGAHSAGCTPEELREMVKGHIFLTQEIIGFIFDLKKEIRDLSDTNPLTIGAFLFHFGAAFLALCVFHIFFG